MTIRIPVLALCVTVALGGWGCTQSGLEVSGSGTTPAAAPAGQSSRSEGSAAKRSGTTEPEGTTPAAHSELNAETKDGKIMLSDEEWKRRLTPEQYYVCRQKGTERAFSGKYWNNKKDGTYLCAACGNELFSSETKFDSGTGWPSYWAPVDKDSVKTEKDRSFFMTRTEVVCSRCGSHLGHVFDDGPAPTNLRYCINSVALDFKEKEKNKESK